MNFIKRHYKATSLILFALALIYFNMLQNNLLQQAKSYVVAYVGKSNFIEINSFDKYASFTIFLPKKKCNKGLPEKLSPIQVSDIKILTKESTKAYTI